MICQVRGEREFAWLGWASVIALVTLSGCADNSDGPRDRFGQQAVDLARQVPACSKVREAPDFIDQAVGPAATCRIESRSVEFIAFADAKAAEIPLTSRVPEALAYADSWNAALVGKAPLSVQRRIVTRIAKALDGQVSILK